MSKKAERSQPIIGYKKTAHTISGIWGIPGGAENHPPYAKAISSEHRHCLDKQSTPICAAASNTADRPIYKFLLLTKVRRRSRHPKQRNFLMWPWQTRFESCWWQFFFFFIPREAEGYSVRLSVCPTLEGVHCVTFAATPITAQLWLIRFWKAQVT